MLFDLWEKYIAGESKYHESSSLEAGRPTLQKLGSRITTGRAGRELSDEEEVALLTRLLNDEWDRIDLNYDGELDFGELKKLLLQCAQLEPTDEIVEKLLEDMSGPDSEVVLKGHFIRYLCSLQSDITRENAGACDEPRTCHRRCKWKW
eukprot:SRR837773.10918.p3 GENE.SRR837773.10918~~SRR837773.10918.p3  ORF type:complete len:149 (-),score=43.92 SRR837773.10918:519-965(-)